MLIEYKLGSFEAKLGAKIASVTSGHNVTCFDYEAMISPLFRWPDLVFHFINEPFSIRDTLACGLGSPESELPLLALSRLYNQKQIHLHEERK